MYNKNSFNLKLKSVLAGLISGVIAIITLCILFSLITVSVDNTEYTLFSVLSNIIYIFSSFFAGYVSGKVNKEKGLIVGALTGFCLVIVALTVSLILKNFNFGIKTVLKIIISVLSAGIGGIVAVNKKKTVII